MEIIASGCSFTAGDELVELIPNYLSKGPDPELYKQYNKQVGYIRNDMKKWQELLNPTEQIACRETTRTDDNSEVKSVSRWIYIEEICWRVLKQMNRNFRKLICNYNATSCLDRIQRTQLILILELFDVLNYLLQNNH